MTTTTFRLKYGITWLLTGVSLGIGGVVGLISSNGFNSSGEVLLTPFIFGLVIPFFGFIGMILDAAVNHRWKIQHVSYHPLAWYLLPLIAAISFMIGMIIASFQGNKA